MTTTEIRQIMQNCGQSLRARDFKDFIDWIIKHLSEISLPWIIYVSNSSTKEDELTNGSMAFPYKTIQEAIDVAKAGNVICIGPGDYTNEIVEINGKNELVITTYGNVKTGTINITNSTNLILHNFDAAPDTLNISGGVVYLDKINNAAINTNATTIIESCKNLAGLKVTGGKTEIYNSSFISTLNTNNIVSLTSGALNIYDCTNLYIQHTNGNLGLFGDNRFKAINDIIINSSANSGYLRLEGGTCYLDTINTYGKINKTGTCNYTLTDFVLDPNDNRVLNGTRIGHGFNSIQTFDNKDREGYTKHHKGLDGHLDGISDRLVELNIKALRANHIYIAWQGSLEKTRAAVPDDFRRTGLVVTTINPITGITLCHEYIGYPLQNTQWIADKNWKDFKGERGIRLIFCDYSKLFPFQNKTYTNKDDLETDVKDVFGVSVEVLFSLLNSFEATIVLYNWINVTFDNSYILIQNVNAVYNLAGDQMISFEWIDSSVMASVPTVNNCSIVYTPDTSPNPFTGTIYIGHPGKEEDKKHIGMGYAKLDTGGNINNYALSEMPIKTVKANILDTIEQPQDVAIKDLVKELNSENVVIDLTAIENKTFNEPNGLWKTTNKNDFDTFILEISGFTVKELTDKIQDQKTQIAVNRNPYTEGYSDYTIAEYFHSDAAESGNDYSSTFFIEVPGIDNNRNIRITVSYNYNLGNFEGELTLEYLDRGYAYLDKNSGVPNYGLSVMSGKTIKGNISETDNIPQDLNAWQVRNLIKITQGNVAENVYLDYDTLLEDYEINGVEWPVLEQRFNQLCGYNSIELDKKIENKNTNFYIKKENTVWPIHKIYSAQLGMGHFTFYYQILANDVKSPNIYKTFIEVYSTGMFQKTTWEPYGFAKTTGSENIVPNDGLNYMPTKTVKANINTTSDNPQDVPIETFINEIVEFIPKDVVTLNIQALNGFLYLDGVDGEVEYTNEAVWENVIKTISGLDSKTFIVEVLNEYNCINAMYTYDPDTTVGLRNTVKVNRVNGDIFKDDDGILKGYDVYIDIMPTGAGNLTNLHFVVDYDENTKVFISATITSTQENYGFAELDNLSRVPNHGLSKMPTLTFKGNSSNFDEHPQDLTVTEMQNLLGISGGNGADFIYANLDNLQEMIDHGTYTNKPDWIDAVLNTFNITWDDFDLILDSKPVHLMWRDLAHDTVKSYVNISYRQEVTGNKDRFFYYYDSENKYFIEVLFKGDINSTTGVTVHKNIINNISNSNSNIISLVNTGNNTGNFTSEAAYDTAIKNIFKTVNNHTELLLGLKNGDTYDIDEDVGLVEYYGNESGLMKQLEFKHPTYTHLLGNPYSKNYIIRYLYKNNVWALRLTEYYDEYDNITMADIYFDIDCTYKQLIAVEASNIGIKNSYTPCILNVNKFLKNYETNDPLGFITGRIKVNTTFVLTKNPAYTGTLVSREDTFEVPIEFVWNSLIDSQKTIYTSIPITLPGSPSIDYNILVFVSYVDMGSEGNFNFMIIAGGIGSSINILGQYDLFNKVDIKDTYVTIL